MVLNPPTLLENVHHEFFVHCVCCLHSSFPISHTAGHRNGLFPSPIPALLAAKSLQRSIAFCNPAFAKSFYTIQAALVTLPSLGYYILMTCCQCSSVIILGLDIKAQLGWWLYPQERYFGPFHELQARPRAHSAIALCRNNLLILQISIVNCKAPEIGLFHCHTPLKWYKHAPYLRMAS